MEIAPFPQEPKAGKAGACACVCSKPSLIGMAAGGALLAGAVLLLFGRRKSGMVAAVSGASLAMIEERETVRVWWGQLPGFIDKTQDALAKTQEAIHEIDVRRERLAKILKK